MSKAMGIFLFLAGGVALGQIRLENSKTPLLPPKDNNFLKPSTDNSFNLDLLKPTEKVKPLALEKEKTTIGFGEKSNLLPPGENLKKRFDEGDPKLDLTPFERDQYMGDVTTSSSKVRMLCRDYQNVDGDYVRVFLNDQLVAPRVSLTHNYSVLNFELAPGFNKIEIEAANMGRYPPNTAEFMIYDDQGTLIGSEQWAIATGYKATFVIVKQ